MASNLEELMGDAEFYGWERVRAYYEVWLNQLEQGQATWEEEEENIRFWYALIWYPSVSAFAASSTSVALSTRKQQKLGFAYSALARPGMKACKAFNGGSCTNVQPIPANVMSIATVWPWLAGPSPTRR